MIYKKDNIKTCNNENILHPLLLKQFSIIKVFFKPNYKPVV